MKNAMDSTALIESLSDTLTPMKPMAHPFLRVLPWIFCGAFYTLVCVLVIGVRPDIQDKIVSPYFVYEILMMTFVGLSASFASSYLCVPDMRGVKWLAALPLTALGAFFLWIFTRSLAEPVSMPHVHWVNCFNDGIVLGFIPAIAMVIFVRKGATTAPRMMALMNTLAVAALGFIGLRFTCPLDTIGHAVITHLIPFMVLGILTGVLARRLYRW